MRRTQRDLVLELLNDGGWHSTIEFVDLGILRAPSRVWELRCGGFPIECRRRPDRRSGKAIWEYRLEPGAPRRLPGAAGRDASRIVVTCPGCRAPKAVTAVRAGLAYLSCGLHHVPAEELEEDVA